MNLLPMGFWNRLKGWFLFSKNSPEAAKLVDNLLGELADKYTESCEVSVFTRPLYLELCSLYFFRSFDAQLYLMWWDISMCKRNPNIFTFQNQSLRSKKVAYPLTFKILIHSSILKSPDKGKAFYFLSLIIPSKHGCSENIDCYYFWLCSWSQTYISSFWFLNIYVLNSLSFRISS